jgi:hypothetical protein
MAKFRIAMLILATAFGQNQWGSTAKESTVDKAKKKGLNIKISPGADGKPIKDWPPTGSRGDHVISNHECAKEHEIQMEELNRTAGRGENVGCCNRHYANAPESDPVSGPSHNQNPEEFQPSVENLCPSAERSPASASTFPANSAIDGSGNIRRFGLTPLHSIKTFFFLAEPVIQAKNELVAALMNCSQRSPSVTPSTVTEEPLYIITFSRSCGDEQPTLVSNQELQMIFRVLSNLSCSEEISFDFGLLFPDASMPSHSTDVIIAAIREWLRIEDLSKKCKLCVFNEMFFSQTQPLDENRLKKIRDAFLALSRKDKHAVYYPNFLYTCMKKLTVEQIKKMLNVEGDRRKDRGITCVQYEGGEDNKVSSKIEAAYAKARKLTAPTDIHLLRNETCSVSNGTVLTSYKKYTYHRESNDAIIKGALYDFGPGVDESAPALWPYCGEASANLPALRDTLLNNVSTEICFDLECAVRNSNKWTNNTTGKPSIHIVQSNFIDISGPTCRDNLLEIALIVHADPKYAPVWTALKGLWVVDNCKQFNYAHFFKEFSWKVDVERKKVTYNLRIFKI